VSNLHVERRRGRLVSAIAAAEAVPDPALVQELREEEHRLLNAPGWELTDRTFRDQARRRLAQWFTLGQSPRERILADPVLRALGEEPRTTAELDLLPEVPPVGGETDERWLEAIRAALVAVGGSEAGGAAFEETLTSAWRDWFLEGVHAYPWDDIAVLLPVRLETFFPDDRTLWLRVVPDEASIRRDVRTVAADEEKALDAFWVAALADNGVASWTGPMAELLERDATGPAWNHLCAAVEPARAAWLLSAFPPSAESLAAGTPAVAIPADRRAESVGLVNHVAGFPETFDVWAVWEGDEALRRLEPTPPVVPVDGGRLLLDQERAEASRRQIARDAGIPIPGLPDEDIPVEERAWWIDWDAACAVGLGLVFDLPAGCTPATLRTLYVTGRSDESPTDLFRAHAEAGELAFVPLGTPTNAVTGSESAHAAAPDDPGVWRSVAAARLRALAPEAHPYEFVGRLSVFLTGTYDALPHVPGLDGLSREETDEISVILASALWPSLRGHLWRDIHGQGADADALGLWALGNLRPEGPLHPIRIGDQPYGLLPVSSLERWEVEPQPIDPHAGVERLLVRQLRAMRDAWAAAANLVGTAAGKDAAGFLDLLGKDALSRRYIRRTFRAAEFFALPYLLEDPGQDLRDELRQRYESLDERLGTGVPERFYLTRGGWANLELPLVQPQPALVLREVSLAMLIGMIEQGQSASAVMERFFGAGEIPRSLLVRLLLHSAFLAHGTIGQRHEELRSGTRLPLLDPPFTFQNDVTAVEEARKGFHHEAPREPQLAVEVLRRARTVAEILDDLQLWKTPAERTPEERSDVDRRLAGLDRALRATLDTAAHRIDPWVTGLAWRRLVASVIGPAVDVRLGVYGWLDGPFTGTPGPTEAGLLHTPSHAQTLTAVILRDKYLSARLEGDPEGEETWRMNLDSSSVRLVEELTEEVRLGSHPYEALGRRVEQVLATHALVAKVRDQFPLRPDAEPKDPNAACDGRAALASALLAPGGTIFEGLDTEGRGRIELLRRTTDVYGDLLVAEAVHAVVSGRPDGANAAMEAAAGLGKPPDLEFVRTPAAGVALKSTALVILSAVDAAPPSRPAALADAAAAAWIDATLGDGWTWTVSWWRSAPVGNGPTATDCPPHDPAAHATDTVTLAEMDLAPADAALLPDDLLRAIAAAISRARLAGLLPDLDETGVADAFAGICPPARHAQARRAVMLLGGPPATAEDVALATPGARDTPWTALDESITTELRNRYEKLRAVAADLVARLRGQPTRDVVREAMLWGLLPAAAPDGLAATLAWLHGVSALEDEAVTSLATPLADALDRRLEAAPKPEPAGGEGGGASGEHAERNLRRPQEIARAIAELAAGDGRVAVLGRIKTATLEKLCPLESAPALESGWLTTVAAVRSHMAQVEAWNLAADTGGGLPRLAPFSTHPADPWQEQVAQEMRALPADGRRTAHTVAAFADPTWREGKTLALAVIDGWVETVPALRHATRAAFGFNAPAARAPQAILLAVPPVARSWLDPETLAGIVAETRTLAHARAARLEDVAAHYARTRRERPAEDPIPFHDLRATMMLQTAPWTGIELENRPWWE
jgi:hypothetical protein